MKVTLNWLKHYVDFNWSPAELTERLTMLGLEVEGVKKVGGEFEGIVVAEVITRDKHPNADKLSVCRVNTGQGERQIVCGADNFKAGDKVPLILPGASLPLRPGDKEPFTIKVGKIRGVESHGMMCSPAELGLPDEVPGLLILRAEAKVGQPFAEYLGRAGSDVVFDLEVTPNRPDLNSVIGIAREIAALTGNPLKIPGCELGATEATLKSSAQPPLETWVSVQLDEAGLCPRYTARVITGVRVGPSPDWLRLTLEKVGIRSINNIVDVTNFVMLEVGQPLHAFDYRRLAGAGPGATTPARLIVRRARAGEKFKTLDSQERVLSEEMLLIADTEQALALAGVMGGQSTEISESTRDVLLESAYFVPTNIRRTSKALGLRSESSYRFERGADVGICEWASRRATQLILETSGGALVEGVVDLYPQPVEPRTASVRLDKVKELLGVEISREEAQTMLGRLGLVEIAAAAPAEVSGNADIHAVLKFRIPSFRVDLKREVDLIEEVVRLYGVDRVPSTVPRGAVGFHPFDAVYDVLADVRQVLLGLGLSEAQGQTLVGRAECRGPEELLLPLANPLSADMDVLRPSLIPGLLNILRQNLSRKSPDVALFEIGRVFRAGPEGPQEERRLAVALTGQRWPSFWSGEARGERYDMYDLKGVVEELVEHFGLRGVAFGKRAEPTGTFLESATIALGGKLPLGELGQLLPALAKRYDLRDAVFLAELNLDVLLARRNSENTFKPLPQFPSSRRDVALLVPEETTHEQILSVVKQAKLPHLERVELFDVFRGKHVPAGQKSMAYAFTYRAADKTLTDTEVNAAHDKGLAALKAQLSATLRDS